ncbi:SDR family NAD(P)-dependent oxidoreductase [Ornithinimicrobium sp. Arc0846-15]|nr:SDR family NAD(P)-dependent oxidoreductase [Ornithinimicrobium laminariae]
MAAKSPNLRAKVVVITGAAGSIGSALVEAVTAAGGIPVGVDIPTQASDVIFGCDITDEACVATTFRQILADQGRIDVLINNAGLSLIGDFDEHDIAAHQRVMAVNYFGALACTQAALPALKASRGRIVTVSSVAGFAPVVGRPAYVGSKHAVTGLFEALRSELEPDGVSVTLVHPTFVAAPMVGTEHRPSTGGEVTPQDVADAIINAIEHGRDRVLVGRIAKLSWYIRRASPSLYARMMSRRIRKAQGAKA